MFHVIVAQTAVYNGERTAVTIRTQQMVSSLNQSHHFPAILIETG